MENQIDWKKECEKIASEIVEDVCHKFVGNEKIELHITPTLKPGPVYGRLAYTRYPDKQRTVIIEYSIIPRSEIKLDKEVLYQIALDKMLNICAMECWQEHKSSLEFANTLCNFAEHAVGEELDRIFSVTATANPDKYPIWKTHGHAVRKIDPTRMVKALDIKDIDLL